MPSLQILKQEAHSPPFQGSPASEQRLASEPLRILPVSWFRLHYILSLPPLPTFLLCQTKPRNIENAV